MKRLKNFLRIIEREASEPSEEEWEYIHYEAKQYLCEGIMPTNKFAKELAYKLVKGAKDMISSKKLPTMPHPQWEAENKTLCQPLDWVPSPDWKPTPPESEEPVKEKGKLHLVKKDNG